MDKKIKCDRCHKNMVYFGVISGKEVYYCPGNLCKIYKELGGGKNG